MIKQQIFNIVFSIILLPVNFCCSFWLFIEALNLTGMTFGEFSEKIGSRMSYAKHRQGRVLQVLTEFFCENSSDPKKSIRLLKTFGFCTLPAAIAPCLAIYSVVDVNNLKYAFVGNIILAVFNACLAACGKAYAKNNTHAALDGRRKRSVGKNGLKNTVVYSLVGAFLIAVPLFFILGTVGITDSGIINSNNSQSYGRSAISVQAELITILNEKGYETANVPTTYWKFDENKLEHIAAGVKDNAKFEFYGYSDDETVDLVYNRIVYCIASESEASETEKYETALSDGNKMFTALINDVYYLVMYRNDTVIYAYSNNSPDEINEILTEMGYLGDPR